MKYIIVLSDGMSDYPIEALSGKTPMEAADKPCMEEMCKKGEVFKVQTVAAGLKPGSDVANLSVMGYDPKKYYTGRSPLEAASIGVTLTESQTAFRANLVTLGGEGEYDDLFMKDYSSDEISSEEAAQLIKTLDEQISVPGIKLYSGVSYRHLMVWDNAPESFKLTPPHDISDRPVKEYLPDNQVILDIMKKSREILKNHPVNIARRERGLHTADSLWIWGEGKKPALSNFYDLFGVKGAVISAVDLIRGIGHLAGMDVIEVPGVTGNVNTNFDGKAQAAIDALQNDADLVYIHLEAPDECGHRGEIENKVRSIELIDRKIIAPIKAQMEKAGIDHKIMVLPDHPTPLSIKTHAGDPVPCLIYDSTKNLGGAETFSEKAAEGRLFKTGHKLMGYFLGKEEFDI